MTLTKTILIHLRFTQSQASISYSLLRETPIQSLLRRCQLLHIIHAQIRKVHEPILIRTRLSLACRLANRPSTPATGDSTTAQMLHPEAVLLCLLVASAGPVHDALREDCNLDNSADVVSRVGGAGAFLAGPGLPKGKVAAVVDFHFPLLLLPFGCGTATWPDPLLLPVLRQWTLVLYSLEICTIPACPVEFVAFEDAWKVIDGCRISTRGVASLGRNLDKLNKI